MDIRLSEIVAALSHALGVAHRLALGLSLIHI